VCLVTALRAERDQLRAALALGQENCDAVYDELRGDCDELRGDVVRLTAERDQLRAKAERFQRLQRFIDTAAAEMKVGLIKFGGIAELRAECDQLRAEMERLRSDRDCEKRIRKDAEELREDAIARAERAEAAETVALAQWNGALERAMKAEAEARSWKASHDNQVKLRSIIMSRADLGDRAPRVEAMMAEVAEANARAERAEAELADHITALKISNRSADEQMLWKREAEAALTAEREKVRVLREALENLRDEQNGAPLCTREEQWTQAMDRADAALAVTEGAK
jgi:hypothetical protein